MIGQTPCSAAAAVSRALSLVGNGGQYLLGTGDYRPLIAPGGVVDLPWTARGRDGKVGADCAGYICWCYQLKRHRPGFNLGSWATVSDDLNCNSLLEDALHREELGELVTTPAPGVLLLYPTIRIHGVDGELHEFIGHVGIVTGVGRCTAWDAARPPYHLMDVAQCRGPDGRSPAVIATDGSLWEHHDAVWPKPEHRTRMVRMLGG